MPNSSALIPQTWLQGLQALFAKFDRLVGFRAQLASDMENFVLRGEPIAILQEVVRLPAVAKHLRMTGYQYEEKEENPFLYRDFTQVPIDIGLRLARLLEAAMRADERIDEKTCYALVFPDHIHWPEILLMHTTGRSLHGWSTDRPKVRYLTAGYMEALLVAADMPPAALLVASFSSPVKDGFVGSQRLTLMTDLPDYGAYLERHLEQIRPYLRPAQLDQRLIVLSLFEVIDTNILAAITDELAELATVSSKQVRAVAEPLACKVGAAMLPALKALALKAKTEQRMAALQLLWVLAGQLGDRDLYLWIGNTAAADKAHAVQTLGLNLKREVTTALPVESDIKCHASDISWATDLTPSIDKAIKLLWQEANLVIDKDNQKTRVYHARARVSAHQSPLTQLQRLSEAQMAELQDYLTSPEAMPNARQASSTYYIDDAILRFALAPGVTPVTLLKTSLYLTPPQATDADELPYSITSSFNAMHQNTGRPDLLELAQMLNTVGYSKEHILYSYCRSSFPLAEDWSVDKVQTFFMQNQDLLASKLRLTNTRDYFFDRKRLFKAVSLLPAPGESIINALFGLALGTHKDDRLAAQDVLQSFEYKEDRIIAALSSSKSEARAVAAQWLGQLHRLPAVPHLEIAVNKESNDAAKGAMLDALQKLGQGIEKYINRQALQKDALTTLKKAVHKDMAWFPWKEIPLVRWADSGDLVTPEILRHLLLQAYKQKSPEPNVVLRKLCGMFDTNGREQFGQFVLQAWLQQDLRPHTQEAAQQLAADYARQTFSAIQKWPQHYQNDPSLGRSVEEIQATYLPYYLAEPAGSAIASKGILAIMAACSGGGAALVVERYLKEYYGTRAAQGKALIAALAWVDQPSAIQLVLATGTRFRTRSIQEEAAKQAQAMATRKAWTLPELADRTIPTAGLDAEGSLELSYGKRSFIARLHTDLKLHLSTPEGNPMASMPEPRVDDDAAMAKMARQMFTNVKKELKTILTHQTERLHEAICTERIWVLEEWQQYLQRHPVMRYLVQSLIWSQVEDGQAIQSFRPMDDGSLSDCDNKDVMLPAGALIRLAHDSNLSAELITSWQQHLLDYKVIQPFQQIGKTVYNLTDDQRKMGAIKDFEGHLMQTFALRNKTLKLGYNRAKSEDGGWFYRYEKRFAALALIAYIEFTGNVLPEEDRTVALLHLSFGKILENGAISRLVLEQLPPVLLSECFNDLSLLAATGSGFDVDWEKKTAY